MVFNRSDNSHETELCYFGTPHFSSTCNRRHPWECSSETSSRCALHLLRGQISFSLDQFLTSSIHAVYELPQKVQASGPYSSRASNQHAIKADDVLSYSSGNISKILLFIKWYYYSTIYINTNEMIRSAYRSQWLSLVRVPIWVWLQCE